MRKKLNSFTGGKAREAGSFSPIASHSFGGAGTRQKLARALHYVLIREIELYDFFLIAQIKP